MIEAYQKKRIVQFLNPQSDPLALVIRSFSHILRLDLEA
ncbi:hypothetical protein JCM19239_3421 [Vibrio variabilis]|uniref:Uncharacterized protein n=1 Tax=Vibrio variabilis TaxID=990271 RepID=A0ABQ0JGU8_9VIBR|nr:hypothetical protein JCM19239_3421 [Vibrio variabilis]